MITSWDIYWITRLDSICFGLNCLGLFIFFFMVIYLVLMMIKNDDDDEPSIEIRKRIMRKFIKIISITSAIMFATNFVPTTKQMVAIIVVPKMINNEKIQQIPENVADFLNTELKKWIHEAKKGN